MGLLRIVFAPAFPAILGVTTWASPQLLLRRK
jgi:hypothetical protein